MAVSCSWHFGCREFDLARSSAAILVFRFVRSAIPSSELTPAREEADSRTIPTRRIRGSSGRTARPRRSRRNRDGPPGCRRSRARTRRNWQRREPRLDPRRGRVQGTARGRRRAGCNYRGATVDGHGIALRREGLVLCCAFWPVKPPRKMASPAALFPPFMIQTPARRAARAGMCLASRAACARASVPKS